MEQYITPEPNLNSHTNPYSNINRNNYIQSPKIRLVAFRNIMLPMNNFQNLQNDYNNTDVKVEILDDTNNMQLLDNSYEKNIIQNTVDSVSKVHNIEIKQQSIIKDEHGTITYKQDIPMTSTINNISQRLFNELKQTDGFKHITIEDIRNLIFKRNIREWNQPIIKEFVKELRAFSNEKSVFMKNVHASQHPSHHIQHIQHIPNTQHITQHTTQQPIQNSNLQKKINNYETQRNLIDTSTNAIYNANFITNTNTQNSLQNKEMSTNTFSMTINSDDRNKELYPSSYDFKMIFENKNNNIDKIKGTIYQNMENMININKIHVSSVIIPSTTDIDNYPYLLLEIEELGGTGNGSNEWLDKCLGKLYFSQKLGKFHIHTSTLSTIEKKFKTSVDLNSITIRIRKPNGDIWVNDSELPLTIELIITQIKKQINNLSLNLI